MLKEIPDDRLWLRLIDLICYSGDTLRVLLLVSLLYVSWSCRIRRKCPVACWFRAKLDAGTRLLMGQC